MEGFKFATAEDTNEAIARLETLKRLNQIKEGLLQNSRLIINNLGYREEHRMDKIIDPDMIGAVSSGMRKIDEALSPTEFDFERFDNGLESVIAGLDTMFKMSNQQLRDNPEDLFYLRSRLDEFALALAEMGKNIDEQAHPQTSARIKHCLSLIADRSSLLMRKIQIVSQYQGR
jgi:hypothetical protein